MSIIRLLTRFASRLGVLQGELRRLPVLILVLGGFLSGCLWGQWLVSGESTSLFQITWILVWSLVWGGGILLWLSSRFHWFWRWRLGLILVTFAIGTGWILLQDQSTPGREFDAAIGYKTEFTGQVVRLLKEHDRTASYVVRVTMLDDQLIAPEEQRRVLAFLPGYERYVPGSQIRGVATLRDLTETPEGYRQYLNRRQVQYQLVFPHSIEVVVPAPWWHPLGNILQLRRAIEGRVDRLWPDPEAPLLAGLLLGSERYFPPDFAEALRRTGTTHIVAVSGYNVSVVIFIVVELVRRVLPRKRQLLVLTIGIILFALLVGMSASVIRASVMAWVFLLARHVGRRMRVTYALLLSVGLIVLFDVRALRDIGLQLSVLATAGIVWFYPLLTTVFPLASRLAERPVGQGLASYLRWGMVQYLYATLLVTIAAQILVLPLLITAFGEVSWIAPLANLLVLFAIPWAMLLGSLAVLADFLLIAPLGFLLGMATYLPLHYMVRMISWCGQLPGSMLTLGWSVGMISLWWGGWLWLLLWQRLRQEPSL